MVVFHCYQEVTASTGALATIEYPSESGFGYSIAMTNDYAIIGAHGSTGRKAFIFKNTAGTWSTTAVVIFSIQVAVVLILVSLLRLPMITLLWERTVQAERLCLKTLLERGVPLPLQHGPGIIILQVT